MKSNVESSVSTDKSGTAFIQEEMMRVWTLLRTNGKGKLDMSDISERSE